MRRHSDDISPDVPGTRKSDDEAQDLTPIARRLSPYMLDIDGVYHGLVSDPLTNDDSRKAAPDRGNWLLTCVDHTWQNPNRIPAAQGTVVTVSAVRKRLA